MTRSTASRTQITETDFLFSFPDVFYVQNGPTDCRAVLSDEVQIVNKFLTNLAL